MNAEDRVRWEALVSRELKGRSAEDLVWHTPEGIAVRPLYTEADLGGVGHLGSLPGLAPFDYEWEQIKRGDLTPEEVERLKAYVRFVDQMMTEIENGDP